MVGFSAVFVALGAGAAFFGGLLEAVRPQLTQLAGAVMIGMGLIVVGLVRWPGFYSERLSFAGAPIDGVLVWAPCSGSLGLTVSIFSYAGEVTIGVVEE